MTYELFGVLRRICIVLLYFVDISYSFHKQGIAGRRQLADGRPLQNDLFFELIQPSSLNYLFRLRPAKDFGLTLNRTYFHIELVISEPLHACTPLTNSAYVHGSVALIERGDCSFLSKTLTAYEAGAVAVVIKDNDNKNSQFMIDMIDDGTSRPVDIAAFFMHGKDGYMILKQLMDLGMRSAVINIPVNGTLLPLHPQLLQQPPWTVW